MARAHAQRAGEWWEPGSSGTDKWAAEGALKR